VASEERILLTTESRESAGGGRVRPYDCRFLAEVMKNAVSPCREYTDDVVKYFVTSSFNVCPLCRRRRCSQTLFFFRLLYPSVEIDRSFFGPSFFW